jgi:hypothetical protein
MLSVKLVKDGTLKVYEKYPHGMCTTHADVITPTSSPSSRAESLSTVRSRSSEGEQTVTAIELTGPTIRGGSRRW